MFVLLTIVKGQGPPRGPLLSIPHCSIGWDAAVARHPARYVSAFSLQTACYGRFHSA